MYSLFGRQYHCHHSLVLETSVYITSYIGYEQFCKIWGDCKQGYAATPMNDAQRVIVVAKASIER